MNPEYASYTPPQSTRNRRLLQLLVVLVLLILIIIGSSIVRHFAADKTVSLHATTGTTIQLGKPFGTGNNATTLGTVLARTTTQTKVKLAPGTYIIVFSGTGYEQQSQVIKVNSSNLTITTPSLNYNADKLSALLSQDQAAINAQLGSITGLSGYTVAYQKLYSTGNWYGAVFKPADPTTQNNSVVVLHDQNGVWTTVAPPSIVLYTGDYPSIPLNVLRDVDTNAALIT